MVSKVCIIEKKVVTLQPIGSKEMIETYDNMARSRIYSSLFSRRVVGEVLKGQYTSIDKICDFFELTLLSYIIHSKKQNVNRKKSHYNI